MGDHQPYVTIRSRRPHDGNSVSSADSTVGARISSIQSRRVRVDSQTGHDQYGSSSGDTPRPATHDISRVSYHVKHLDAFAQTLENSANRAFPNRRKSSQRYSKVQALLLHWGCDDLFVLPELEDLERCLREDYAFDTEIFPIPSENSHLELMMQIGKLIKDHEAQDTLFLVYYGGHARIDESRQSTWCATRHPDSPWLQWSAIQTLLERSASDVLILLDCCAGAASATFPNGNSITETISASSWDAIAPDPGRYSFTNALIEVMQEWRLRTFSAAMLHAEVLARLKHPRPVTINGKVFEARSTPVHFMMTSNHKAPSIELSRVVPPEQRPPSPLLDTAMTAEDNGSPEGVTGGRGPGAPISGEPNEDTPHVMISLALEDNQQLDLSAWEQWLSNFPALAKYVKVQGVFKSHSTLLLLSMPVMVWDLLPDDHATSFIAFIRSNNLVAERIHDKDEEAEVSNTVSRGARVVQDNTQPDSASMGTFFSDVTYTNAPTERSVMEAQLRGSGANVRMNEERPISIQESDMGSTSSSPVVRPTRSLPSPNPTASIEALQRHHTSSSQVSSEGPPISRSMIPNQQRSARRTMLHDIPEPPKFSQHVEILLQQYYRQEPLPNDDQKNFVASNLGIELWHVEAWFHHRRERDIVSQQFQTLRMGGDPAPGAPKGAQMILPHHLQRIIEVLSSSRILMIDLRPPADFEKSHIKGAINLRAPLSFIREASFEMIERAFPHQSSRQVFGEWQSATCLVIYDRVIDASRECPLADVLYDKFRTWGWPGRCFVLKGHYREFSVSYKTSITGSKVSSEAGHQQQQQQQQNPDPLRQETSTAAPSETDDAAARRSAQYQELLTQIDNEGIVVNTSSNSISGNYYYASSSRPDPNHDDHDPSATSSGRGARATTSQHERDLEAEFRRRVPDLYRKALEVHDSSGSGGGRAAETPCDASASGPAPGAAEYTGAGGGDGTGIAAETVTGTATALQSSEEAATGTETSWDGSTLRRRRVVDAGGDRGGGGNNDNDNDEDEDGNSSTATCGFDTKAPLVEYLDRGLSHIRQGKPVTSAATDSWRPIDKAPSTSSSSLSLTNTTNTAIGGMSKLAAEGCHAHFDSGAARLATPLGVSSDDSYVKISRGDVQYAGDLPAAGVGAPPNPGHQQQTHHHHHGGLVGGKDGTTRDAHVVGPSGDETPKRGRGGFLNKVLRRA
ncbi:hypothetical protein BDP55DRAFT_666844 [Colletotrichum godetiae]|uniref:Tyrosine-protein phosphatase non-receptor type 6 n=1 Tax=Colletotrichum godetiae TaxID=1209918 RepID=A0AAJ0ES14_9PEZI|nr:uncharacterized protein BDP55DRAFT_666844 [Colletotrichum godetiae]KAK1674556.1 hypothetical protein BDP55DRAFT_666844 [Colletotrichum godetiae]